MTADNVPERWIKLETNCRLVLHTLIDFSSEDEAPTSCICHFFDSADILQAIVSSQLSQLRERLKVDQTIAMLPTYIRMSTLYRPCLCLALAHRYHHQNELHIKIKNSKNPSYISVSSYLCIELLQAIDFSKQLAQLKEKLNNADNDVDGNEKSSKRPSDPAVSAPSLGKSPSTSTSSSHERSKKRKRRRVDESDDEKLSAREQKKKKRRVDDDHVSSDDDDHAEDYLHPNSLHDSSVSSLSDSSEDSDHNQEASQPPYGVSKRKQDASSSGGESFGQCASRERAGNHSRRENVGNLHKSQSDKESSASASSDASQHNEHSEKASKRRGRVSNRSDVSSEQLPSAQRKKRRRTRDRSPRDDSQSVDEIDDDHESRAADASQDDFKDSRRTSQVKKSRATSRRNRWPVRKRTKSRVDIDGAEKKNESDDISEPSGSALREALPPQNSKHSRKRSETEKARTVLHKKKRSSSVRRRSRAQSESQPQSSECKSQQPERGTLNSSKRRKLRRKKVRSAKKNSTRQEEKRPNAESGKKKGDVSQRASASRSPSPFPEVPFGKREVISDDSSF